jgi:hypothetical protein
MILNLSPKMAHALLACIDVQVDVILEQLPKTHDPHTRAELTQWLRQLGGVKHRLHHGLGIEAFDGPSEWGHPFQRSDR